jgi:hypothetical protein
MEQREDDSDCAAQGEPDQMGTADPEVGKHRSKIVHVGVRSRRERRLAEPAEVVTDDKVPARQSFSLAVPRAVVQAETVDEDDRWPVASRLEMEVSAGNGYASYFFRPAAQFITTERGTEELFVTGTFNKKRSPSAETSQLNAVPSGS